jgi:transposase
VSGIPAEGLIADKGYDSDAVVVMAEGQGMEVCIPPRRNRKNPRAFDEHRYKQRHRVENAFLHLKAWRGIATRYAKRQSSFLSAVCLRCAIIWASIS